MSIDNESSSICRLCTELLVESTSIFLFGENGLQCNIGDIILQHFNVEIRPTDHHSKHICSSCWSVTSNFHELFARVQRTAYRSDLVKTESIATTADEVPDADEHSSEHYDLLNNEQMVEILEHPETDTDTDSNQPIVRKTRLQTVDNSGPSETTTTPCDGKEITSGHAEVSAHCCDKCEQIFARPTQLAHHRRKMHNDSKAPPKKFRCDKCEKFFVNKYVLANHVRAVHENAFAHMCHVCAKTFKSKHVFELHQHEHLDHDIPKLQCNICGNWLKHEHSLRKHIARHFQTQQTCQLCGKVVPNVHALGNHMRYVHSERSWKCTLCQKSFRKSIELKEHMAAHTGVDLYTCPYCPQAFKSSANMYSHRKKRHMQQWQQDREQRLK